MQATRKIADDYFYSKIFLDAGFVIKELSQFQFIAENRIVTPFEYRTQNLPYFADNDLAAQISNEYINTKKSEFNAFSNRLKSHLEDNKKNKEDNQRLLQDYIGRLNHGVTYLEFENPELIPSFLEDNAKELEGFQLEINITLNHIHNLFLDLIKLSKKWIDSIGKEYSSYINGNLILDKFEMFDTTDLVYNSKVEGIAMKVALLDKLGVIGHLKSKFPDATDTRMAEILSIIMGKESQAITIRKVYSSLDNSGYSKLRNNPYNSPKKMEKLDGLIKKFNAI